MITHSEDFRVHLYKIGCDLIFQFDNSGITQSKFGLELDGAFHSIHNVGRTVSLIMEFARISGWFAVHFMR